MTTYDLDVATIRGNAIESRHRVHAAVVDARGVLRGRAGDPELVSHWRSCAKPFQVMPLVESGHADRLGWGDDEIALACASHGGEPEHVAIASAMLASLGLEEGDLACGPHTPLSPRGARLLKESGQTATRVHNNCSGKHAAMLALAKGCHWSILGYQEEAHPVQESALAAVSKWSGVPAAKIPCGVDGCSVVTFALPLSAMAAAFGRLAEAARANREPARRITDAMRTRPFLVGGTDRFDSVVMEETDGAVILKVGAEGVHTVALMDEPVAFAIKVEDGAQRAQYPAVLRMLQHLGVLGEELPPSLESFARAQVHNTRGERVGEVRCLA
jgi:L-asparaginase II